MKIGVTIHLQKKLLLLFISFIVLIKGYPTEKRNLDRDLKSEKHYANGTVVGKYTYTDRDGSPIQVKYYADDSGYGVELKNVKVISDDKTDTPVNENDEPKYDSLLMLPEPSKGVPDAKSLVDNYSSSKTKQRDENNFDYLKSDVGKSHYKSGYKGPDYDVFTQNDIKGAKKCGSEKVRVYLEKNSKRIRRDKISKSVDSCDKF